MFSEERFIVLKSIFMAVNYLNIRHILILNSNNYAINSDTIYRNKNHLFLLMKCTQLKIQLNLSLKKNNYEKIYYPKFTIYCSNN